MTAEIETADGQGRRGKADKTKGTTGIERSEKNDPSKQACEFLSRAFAGRTEGFVQVIAIDPAGVMPIEACCAPVRGDYESIENFIREHIGKRNLYWSVNLLKTALTKKASKADILELNHYHIDLDPNIGEEVEAAQRRIVEMMARFEPMPTIVINSGAGYGYFWRLDNPPAVNGNIDELEAINKRLALHLGGDNCHNLDRIMRLPETVNLPTPKKVLKGRGTYRATLIYQDDDSYPPESFSDLPVAEAKKPSISLSAKIPARVIAFAERVPLLARRLSGDATNLNDTSRSGLDYSVASILVKQYFYPDEILATLKGYGFGKIHEEKDPEGYVSRMLEKLGWAPRVAADDEFKPKSINSAVLAALELPPIRWIVPKLIPEGLTIVGGRPKAGKSRFILNICAAVANEQGKALGVLEVNHGGVLMLSLEDSNRRLQHRQREIGLKSERLEYVIEWQRGNIAALETYLDEHPDVIVVVIDTYVRWSPPTSLRNRETPYETDTANLALLKAIADARGIAIVVVHHTRKGEAVDVFDELLGSTGIGGTADTMIILKRVRGERTATLHVTGREVEDDALALEWDDVLFSFKLLGKARDVFITKERQVLLDELRKHKAGIGPTKLGEFVGKSKHAVLDILRKLLEEGYVRRDDAGLYTIVRPDEPI